MLNWFARRLKEAQNKDETGQGGFTLIELLVVVIIIGILAAIAIPVFLNQRQNANTSACRSDVRNGAAAAQAYAADNAGSYAGMTATGTSTGDDLIADYDWNLSAQSSAPTLGAPGGGTAPTATGFTIRVTCANANDPNYTFDSSTGTVTP